MALIAAAYYIDGQKEKGFDLFEKLRKKGFSCADLLDEQTRALMSQGRFDQAVSLLEAAVKTGSISKDTQALFAECRSKITTILDNCSSRVSGGAKENAIGYISMLSE
jgi:hypothetical protein